MSSNLWTYREDTYRSGGTLDGFDVEAQDGKIGSIDESANGAGDGYLVVDTGFWIFGKKRLIPAGVVERIDYDDNKVYVSMTKDQIKSAPDLDDTTNRTSPTWNRDLNRDYYDPYSW